MRFRRGLLTALALVVAAAVSVPASAEPAIAAGDPIVIQLNAGAGVTTITYTADGDLNPMDTYIPLMQAPGCSTTESGAGKLCSGGTVELGDVQPDGVTGKNLVAYGGAAEGALGWIIDEALVAIRATYGVPFDDRLMTYAMPEIRSYILTRVLDIFDRYAYGHTLTADEQLTFDFIENWVLQTDRLVTSAAHEQYKKFQEKKCGYNPPAAPAFVDKPAVMPQNVINWCHRAHNAYDRLFVFAPPQPSMEHFQAWGAYAHAQELGLGELSSGEAQRALMATVTSNVAMGGVALAVGAAAITSALVGTSTTAAFAVSGAYGAFTATGAAMTAFGETLVTSMVGATAPVAAASVVAIVIFGLVMTAIATWHFAEYVKVGEGLLDKKKIAAAATDPFGLDALRALGADRPILGDLEPGKLPGYWQQTNVVRLASLITRWMSITSDGQVVPDATGVWADNATTTRDYRFEVDAGAGFQPADAITVPDGEGGFQEVRFSRDWMIVTPVGGAPRAALSFKFAGADGKNAYAARSIASLGGWVLTKGAVTGPGFWATQTLELQYYDENDVLTKARIVPPQKALGGPHPTAVGPLVPGRSVGLRPNPVAADGSFDLDRYQSDFSYAWKVERLDEETGVWTGVALEDPNAYGTRFTPTEIGQYRAVVRMTDLVDPNAEVQAGLVLFRVSPPEIAVHVLELVDDGEHGLTLRMRFAEPVATDEFAVSVEWPRVHGDPEVAPTTLQLTCHTLGIDCETGPTPTTLQHTLSDASDIAAGVKVTVRNSYGSTLTRTLAIAAPERPVLAEPFIAPTPAQPGTVQVGAGEVSVHLVAESGANPNYVLAEILPGEPADGPLTIGVRKPGGPTSTTVDLLDAGSVYLTVSQDTDTGRWVVGLRGQPDLEDVGTYEIPLTLVQSNGAIAPFLVRLEVSASPADRYRGVLVSTVGLSTPSLPNLQPQVLGGQAEWDEFDGEVCVTFQVGGMTDREELCGPASDFFDEDGAPLPFPYRELLPTGVPAGAATATIQLVAEDNDERVYGVAHEVWFSLTSGAPSTGLAPGSHALTVWADDSAGNFTSRSLTFSVPAGGEEPGGQNGGPQQPGSGGSAPGKPAAQGGSSHAPGAPAADAPLVGDPTQGAGDPAGGEAAGGAGAGGGGGTDAGSDPQAGEDVLDETPTASGFDATPIWIAVLLVLVLGGGLAAALVLMRRRAT